MTDKQKAHLEPVRRKPYQVSSNGRIKLPSVWFAENGPEPTVYMYITPDGDLLVSAKEYRV